MKRKQHGNTPPDPKGATRAVEERRKGERHPADGEVRLFLDDVPSEIRGRLLDTSRSGFRAAHPAVTLRSGQIVGFQHDQRQGTARTIWTRIAGDRVESGFFILDLPHAL